LEPNTCVWVRGTRFVSLWPTVNWLVQVLDALCVWVFGSCSAVWGMRAFANVLVMVGAHFHGVLSNFLLGLLFELGNCVFLSLLGTEKRKVNKYKFYIKCCPEACWLGRSGLFCRYFFQKYVDVGLMKLIYNGLSYALFVSENSLECFDELKISEPTHKSQSE
jgi:hypothetical protein